MFEKKNGDIFDDSGYYYSINKTFLPVQDNIKV